MTRALLSRRRFLTSALIGGTGMAVSGCNGLDGLKDTDNRLRSVMASANYLTYRAQRLLIGGDSLAREFSRSEIRQPMRPNGVTSPPDGDYQALASTGFAGYRLSVGGLVAKPTSFGLAALKAMPARTQITRHDCVEGWSCIAEWTGVPLSVVLNAVRPLPSARFVLLRCFDTIEQGLSGAFKYYETIDLVDAFHAQTILAYGMNGAALPIANGAPLRLRVERQLGYKMAKYVRSIDLIDDFSRIEGGKGGYWEDRGYDWYAGI
ncbi:MAG: molybdopterin-binding protein [Pseudomonadota bacterium]